MKNSPLKLAFAVFGIAVAIFLSCSDGPVLVFPGKDEPLPPSSSGEASSSSAESSSSGEADNSSSSGEADSSSSAESSSNSEETDNSSSSSEEASSSSQCAETDKCNGKCYDRETHFCYNKKEVHERCDGSSYNIMSQMCCGSRLYPNDNSYGCCKGVGYPTSGYGCRDEAVLTRCGADGLYNPLEEFCTSKDEIYDLCGGRQFDPPKEYCDEVGGKDVIKGQCGTTESMNYDTHFCFGGTPYALCGGRDYNPDKQFCSGGVHDKCGGTVAYNPLTEYCHTDGLPYSCGDKPYNPSTQFCSGTAIYSKCGGEDYSPSTQFCSGVTVYDKCGGVTVYNPGTEECCGNDKYTLATHYCHTDGKTYSCGNVPYNPSIEGCCKNSVYQLKRNHYDMEKEQFCDERDGKTYVKVIIGTGSTAQTWMAENLNYKTPDSKSRCYPTSGTTNTNDNDNANCNTYGRLYNWATAMDIDASCNTSAVASCGAIVSSKHTGICPSGWHLPSSAEWTTLINYAGGTSTAATKLRAASEWNTSGNYIPGTDDYGFSALPGGLAGPSGSFSNVNRGYWWSATEYNASNAYYRFMYHNNANVGTQYGDKPALYSVRCVKDL